jgi:hypothetical protein
MTDDELLIAVRTAAKALIAAGRKVNYYTIHKSEPRIRARYQRIYAALDHLTASGEVPYSARSRPGSDAPGEMPVAPAAVRPSKPCPVCSEVWAAARKLYWTPGRRKLYRKGLA